MKKKKTGKNAKIKPIGKRGGLYFWARQVMATPRVQWFSPPEPRPLTGLKRTAISPDPAHQ